MSARHPLVQSADRVAVGVYRGASILCPALRHAERQWNFHVARQRDRERETKPLIDTVVDISFLIIFFDLQ
jgi:hypothetical protein